MLRDLSDQMVRLANITVRTGRKWSASRTVAEAEVRLCHKDVVGRLGLGVITRGRWKDANTKGCRSLVQEELGMVEEEDRPAIAVSIKQEGSWTWWRGVQGRSSSWKNVWSMKENRIKFFLCSTYDVFPTPENLHWWGLAQSPDCTLSEKPLSL